jgi:hypothetical protein
MACAEIARVDAKAAAINFVISSSQMRTSLKAQKMARGALGTGKGCGAGTDLSMERLDPRKRPFVKNDSAYGAAAKPDMPATWTGKQSESESNRVKSIYAEAELAPKNDQQVELT